MELGSDIGTVTGLDNVNQYYNYRITPKQNLVRNQFFINTSLFYKTKEVVYIKSKNNIDIIINSLSELSGDYDYEIGSQLLPVKVSFKTIVTSAIKTFLDSNPNRLITIYSNDKIISGYIDEFNINLYTKQATVTMLTKSIV